MLLTLLEKVRSLTAIDGQGQFKTVIEEEMPEIIKAFKKYDTAQRAYRPKLSIVVCGKRHNTRFFPIIADAADNLGNPKPGTVVDQGVTAVYAFDFFLQAHGGNRIYEAYEGASGDGGTPLRPENDSGSPIGCVQLRPVVCGGKR